MLSCVLPALGGHWSMSTLRRSMSMPLVPLPSALKIVKAIHKHTEDWFVVQYSEMGDTHTQHHSPLASSIDCIGPEPILFSSHKRRLNRSMVHPWSHQDKDDSAMIKVADIERKRDVMNDWHISCYSPGLPLATHPIDRLGCPFLFDFPFLLRLLLLWALVPSTRLASLSFGWISL